MPHRGDRQRFIEPAEWLRRCFGTITERHRQIGMTANVDFHGDSDLANPGHIDASAANSNEISSKPDEHYTDPELEGLRSARRGAMKPAGIVVLAAAAAVLRRLRREPSR
jgi:hypothetical protein